MHFAAFTTPHPADHLIRALNELSRAGFALIGVAVNSADGLAAVRIDFGGVGAVSVETYLTRLQQFQDVGPMQGGPA